jgi:dipeptidyl aminopeptidase/acylaminoacyl peptidase
MGNLKTSISGYAHELHRGIAHGGAGWIEVAQYSALSRFSIPSSLEWHTSRRFRNPRKGTLMLPKTTSTTGVSHRVMKSGISSIAFALLFSIQVAPAVFAGQPGEVPADEFERTVGLMAKIGSAASPSFAPDGSRLAFVTNISGSPQVWTMATTGGYPTLVTAFDDPVGTVKWSPDGEWLACNIAPGGGFNEQIYLVRPDGSALRRLTEGGKENNFLGDWAEDGRHLYFSSNRRVGSSTDSYLLEVASGRMRMVAEHRGTGGINDVSRDGRYAVVSRVISRGDNNLYLVGLADRSEVLLTPHEGPGSFGSAQFSSNGRTVYLTSNKDRDLIAFARVEIDERGKPGGIEVLASRDDAELSGGYMNRHRTVMALLWNVGGRNELAFFDPQNGKVTPGPKLPREIAGGLNFSADGRRLGMVLSGAAAPADIWVLDMSTQQFAQVTKSPHAGVDLTKLVRPELVRYTAHDGLELSGWLYRARGAAAPGAIVLSFHGGPEGQERPGFNSTYQALLARGIAVFAPNVRGSSGFGKRFVNLDNGALRENGVRDIKASVEFVVSKGIADPKRVGIMGGSYGGYMVMAGLAEYPDLFAAGANLFGVVNFETFFKHTQPWMAAISKVEYGDPEKEAEMLKRLSPIHRVDRVKAPTIVLHGANDTNVPVIEAEQVVESLKRRNVLVEYILFPDEGHGWKKTPNRIRSTVEIVRFFEKHLAARPKGT